jgi:RNA polymerase sigma-70 factor (ECF subfamily)
MAARATNQDVDVSLDDARIVQRIAGGDSAALGELYDRWSDAVYAAAFAIVGVAEDAEEVVEDTFWQAWKQASRFETARGAVRSWLLTIARSRAMDKRKSVSRRREEQLESAPADLLVNDARTDDRVVEGERTTMVANALSDLPRVQREVLEMAYFGGLSQSEIADCTGLAIGTIKTRIRLGMMKLREQLAPSRQTTT